MKIKSQKKTDTRNATDEFIRLSLFEKIEVPFDYEKRIEYLQAKLKRLPTSSAHAPPKVYRNK